MGRKESHKPCGIRLKSAGILAHLAKADDYQGPTVLGFSLRAT
jgi:hypothetical protein